MKLNEMRELLATRGIQLTKSLGQNFLHDNNQLRRIADAAELCSSDQVLEIGPGLGPLTEMLLERAGHVLAIEKDARLAGLLRERFKDPKFELLEADALEVLKSGARDWIGWKVVSNLPYSVASPILVELACGARAPEKIVITLQWEVARRLAASAGGEDYGILTLLVQLDFEVRDTFKIPASCFFPEPDVDSACIVLNRREHPLLAENLRGNFVRIVKRAFSQRRKMMFKLLKQDWPEEQLRSAFAELAISPQERAEKLNLEQFVRLADSLTDPARHHSPRYNHHP
ncbi:MAG TPA: 16S rRNA (adenine(1518)-N(6)/adenine(1519)-N(6))-dimethyltransferase RsmA [Verrucomicrobiae bacterium]|jgi:16S rRNA (adenine1518-N6/adenine1519-N6)-dimethyltransferase|nr:16S rRNA (adenine(1518)-N(6)/adenine(1519)-N(6))-dimethyltransferase RsmA [Verrucomicrobiae bacterium]